MSCSV